MQITEDSIDPRLEPGIFPNHYESADAAFDAGNYAQAFLSAGAASTEIGALAAIMCGAVALGLKNLGAPKDDRARLAAAYGRWSLGDADAALAHLGVITNGAYDGPAGRLREMISAPSIAAAVITMPGGEKGRAFADAAGFKVTEISVGPNDFGTPWPDIWEQAGGGEGPRLIIGIDAFGPYLPPGLYQQPAPVALWSSDHDFFLATRHHDHASADLIIVNAAGECAEMSEFYGGRVASLPGHDTYAQGFGARNGRARDVDILFTGRVFASYMRDKAQFLFRLACLEDAALKIEFLNGYLGEEEYAERIAGARFVPTTWRYPGGIQTRCVDAFRGGARVLESDAQSLGGLLGYDRDWFVNASDGVVREIPETDAAMDADLDALFWPSPEREERFLKFCLFQSLFTGERPLHRAPAAIPVELRGYMREPGLQVYTRIASLNAREPGSAADYNYAAAAAFYAAILVPEKSELTE
ncbi:MAG: hypothetical protein QF393_09560, partial [Rhodospirillales bacterium]|nr:hypothetical protein [Rhodospirillales bacterium]